MFQRRNVLQLTSALGGSLQSSASGMYVEVGAHLRLLGESLAIIGERLKEHEVDLISFYRFPMKHL